MRTVFLIEYLRTEGGVHSDCKTPLGELWFLTLGYMNKTDLTLTLDRLRRLHDGKVGCVIKNTVHTQLNTLLRKKITSVFNYFLVPIWMLLFTRCHSNSCMTWMCHDTLKCWYFNWAAVVLEEVAVVSDSIETDMTLCCPTTSVVCAKAEKFGKVMNLQV